MSGDEWSISEHEQLWVTDEWFLCQLSHGWWVESIEAWSLIFDQLWVIESDYKDFYVCLAMDYEWRVSKHDQLWITDDIGNPAFTYIKLCL